MMDELMCRTIVESLAKGLDPINGGVLSDQDICTNNDVQEALQTVLDHCSIESNEQLLKRLKEEREEQRKKRVQENKARYFNQGNPWSTSEVLRLKQLNVDKNIWHVANILGRSPSAIRSKLTSLGIKPNKKRYK